MSLCIDIVKVAGNSSLQFCILTTQSVERADRGVLGNHKNACACVCLY